MKANIQMSVLSASTPALETETNAALTRASVASSGSDRLRWPVWLLAYCAIGTLAYFCKAAILSLLFSVLLAILLSPVVEFLARYRVPRTLSSLLAVGALLACLIVIVDLAWSPALRWMDSAPEVLQQIERKLTPARRIVARIDALTSQASSLTESYGTPQLSSNAPDSELSTLTMTRVAMINVATVAILTVLLLAVGTRTLQRIESVVTNNGSTAHCLNILDSVRAELSHYFSVISLINIGLGFCTTILMYLWGMPSPWLWGVLACLLNYIPYFGPAVSLAIMSAVALVSFPGFAVALGVAGSFLLLTTVEGQLIQPLLIGKRLNLNPIVLFVGIWLAGWFAGIAGIMITTPILITLKEIANRQTENSLLKAILSG